MPHLHRHDIEELSNHLELKLMEVAEVCFDFAGRNRHSFNRIFLVKRESKAESYIVNHSSSEQKLFMKSGCTYFMPCDLDLEFRFQPDMQFISLHFNLKFFASFDVFSGCNICSASKIPRIIKHLSQIIKHSHDIQSICQLQSIVLQIAQQFIPKSNSTFDYAQLAVKYQTLFGYIRHEGDAQTSIGELANKMGMNQATLSREFSRDCGITLKNYLMHEIQHRAEQLLIKLDIPIKDIAQTLNFNNEFYFSRFFRKQTGHCPKTYRQRFRNHIRPTQP